MNKYDSRHGNGIGVGMASVLMIVMVLAFTAFGVLALVSARADQALSQKTAAFTSDWYAAEGRLQEQLATLDAALLSGTAVFKDGYMELTEEAGEGRLLLAVLKETDSSHKNRYEIVEYRLIGKDGWNPEESLKLWDGGN